MIAVNQVDRTERMPADTPARAAGEHFIDVSDVSLWLGRPPHRRLALERVNLSVARNQIVGLVGPSGSGKSTLLKAVGGLLTPDAGDVCIDGQSAADAVKDNRFGWVFQQPVLLPWRNVEQNVIFTAELVHQRRSGRVGRGVKVGIRERAHEMLALVGLVNHVHKYPRELSGGMQQRVAIARALMTEPDILMMDEPFSALDEVIRERLNLVLLDVWRQTGVTIVFVTHSLSEAAFLTDEIYVMGTEPGRIIEHVPVPLERPRTLDTFRSPQFTELTMHLREVLDAASPDEKAQ